MPAALSSRFGRGVPATRRQGSGPQRVVAPMPGKIVRVLVGAGDAVEPARAWSSSRR